MVLSASCVFFVLYLMDLEGVCLGGSCAEGEQFSVSF